MSARAIPPGLYAWIFALYSGGVTSAVIARRLLAEHAIKVSDRTVRKLLQARRSELAATAKEAVRTHLGATLVKTAERLDAVIDRARRLERKALRRALKEKTDFLDVYRAQDRQLRAIGMKLHYSGAGEPDDPALTDKNRQSLLERLERAIEVEEADAADLDPDTAKSESDDEVH